MCIQERQKSVKCYNQSTAAKFFKLKYLATNALSLSLQWTLGNSQLRCRESLIDLLSKPFQRITRYGILMRRIREFTTDEHEIIDLEEIVSSVKNSSRSVVFTEADYDLLSTFPLSSNLPCVYTGHILEI